MEIKTIPIQIHDNQRKNTLDEMSMGGFQPKGRVRIFSRDVRKKENKPKLEVDSNNLIVYRGRNWLMQRAFNKDLTNRTGWKDRFISWLAIGTGGSLASPLEPTAPELHNYQLGSHGTINAGDNYVIAGTKEYRKFDAEYPKLLSDPDVDNSLLPTGCIANDPYDGVDYKCDKFLIGLVKVTLLSEEGNGGTGVGDYQDISEAGLYTCRSNSLTPSTPYVESDMQLFARVCFSTIRKTIDRELIFTWYIYF